MESEKIKAIKKALENQKESLAYIENNIVKIVHPKEILSAIEELESENKRLSNDLDSEWKDRRKADEDLHKAQWNYKIGLSQSQKRNKELKDRIAELEHKCDDCAGCTQWKCDCANIETHALEQFAEWLAKRSNNDIYLNLLQEFMSNGN